MRCAQRGRIERIRAGDDAHDQARILGAHGKRADRIERERERQRIGTADAAIRWFEAGHATEMGWQSDGAAGVGPKGRGDEAGSHRSARTRRRAAGDAGAIPGVAGRSKIGIVSGRAVSELGHVQRADTK